MIKRLRIPTDRLTMPRWERRILIVVVLLFAILFFLGMRVADQVREPRAVSDEFVHSMLSESLDEAYGLTGIAFRQANTKDEFRATAERFDTDIRTTPGLAEQRIMRNEAGVLIATMEYAIPGTEDHRLIVKLVRENGDWVVTNVSRSQ